MELFLVRHAVAEDGDDDDARPLSPRGRKRFAAEARGLKRLGVSFDRLLLSPKRRALETAELLSGLCTGELEVTPLLAKAPGRELLALVSGEGRVALVGHEPWLSALTAWLVCGEQRLGECFEFKKGAVVHLEGAATPGGMRLLASLPPKVLRGVA